jgi:hypothetical protein
MFNTGTDNRKTLAFALQLAEHLYMTPAMKHESTAGALHASDVHVWLPLGSRPGVNATTATAYSVPTIRRQNAEKSLQ